MLVLHPVDDRGRVDEVLTPESVDQGDEVVGVGVEPLQPGQVVGDQHRRLGAGAPGEVPRRPGVAAAAGITEASVCRSAVFVE